MARPSSKPPGWVEERLAQLRVRRLSAETDAKRRWTCVCLDCGRTVLVAVSVIHRQTAKRGCRDCSYSERNQDLRLKESDAVAVAHQAGMRPLEVYRGSNRPWLCECMTCGVVASPRLGNMSQRRSACDNCAKAVRARSRWVPEEEAARSLRAAGLEPIPGGYRGVEQPWPAMCTRCGKTVNPRPGNLRRLGGTGCLWCAPFGLDWAGPAIVYLLQHPIYGCFKVGVATARPTAEPRVRQLARRYGWEVAGQLSVATGLIAYRCEQRLLRWVRDDLGLPAYLGPEETSGHTETFSGDGLSMISLMTRLDAIFDLEAQTSVGSPEQYCGLAAMGLFADEGVAGVGASDRG